VNFWATWCAPCIEELPLLVEAQNTYGPRGFQILGPAMDDAATAAPMALRFGINYPVMADFIQVDAAMRALGNELGALPYSVLVDGDGKVLRSFLGGLRAQDFRDIAQSYLTS
jgi:thiol-disulfide isomerase/thioredoxin